MNKSYIRIILIVWVQLLTAVASFATIDVTTEDVTCNGDDDGKATITVTGATGNFRYSIDGTNFQASNVFEDLEPKSYTATVKDLDTDCEYTKGFSITEPGELDISVSGGGVFTFCVRNGPPTVTLTASASGGTPPYTYNWPGGQLQVSSSGFYTAKVTDKNGCTASSTVFVLMIPIICSRDPNDIIGPPGVGNEKWIAKKDLLPYTIRFENDPEFATAPAQEVRINQILDKHVNIYSLTLGNFGFAGMIFEVPENRTYYTARLDVRDSLGIMVDIIAGIDVNKNEAFWIFRSIDPLTGLPPREADKGFLPVNDSITHKGEGFVSYNIRAKNGTVTGDSIYAEANIIFDINEPILTPKIFNTIDALPPASEIDSIPSVLDSAVLVTVSGHDENGQGSGIASYDLYVSENGGTFEPIAQNVPMDSAYLFSGEAGNNYCLYSVAKDSVGNMEAKKTSGYTCFSVPAANYLSLLQPDGLEEFCTAETMLISWESSGVDTVQIDYSPDGGTSFITIRTKQPANDSMFSWVIPDSLSTRSDYVIRIRDIADSALVYLSDGIGINHPVESVTTSLPEIVCQGDTAVLNAGAGYVSYSWSTGNSTQSITVNTSGLYSVTVIDPKGCEASSSYDLTVHSAPEQPLILADGPTTFCEGESVILTSSVDFESYMWSTGNTGKSVIARYSKGYTLSGIDSNGCESPVSDPVIVTVHLTPRIFIGNDTICEGATTTLVAAGAVTYSWSNGATTAAIDVSPAVTTTYSLTFTDENGCTGNSSSTVVVNPGPAVTVNDTAICEGETATLTASGGAGYIWSTGDTTATILVSPATTTTYSLTVTAANECYKVVTATVTVTPSLTVTVNDSTICEGGTATLTASGGTSYEWSTGAATASIEVSPSTTTTYGVTVTDENGCSGSAISTVTVTPSPVATVNDATICEGGMSTLTASGGTSYEWSTGAATASIEVSPSTTTTYGVTVTDENGCSGSAISTVTVTPSPVATVNDAMICEGGTSTLIASGGTSYEWSTGATTASIEVSPSITTTYGVTVTDENGCSGSAISTVTVTPSPVATVNDATICEGGTATLIASGGTSYEWSTGATTASIEVSPSVTTTYGVTATDENGCIGTAISTVSVNPLPVASVNDTTIRRGETVTLTASGGGTYLWDNGGTTESIQVTPLTTTTYSVTVTNEYGCSDEAVATVTVLDADSLKIICPENILVNNDSGQCQALVNFEVHTEGHCGSVNILYSHNPGSGFPVGTTIVMATAIDECGDSASCSFSITVKDAELPVAICKNITVYLNSNGEASIDDKDVDGGSTDNCGIAGSTVSEKHFTCKQTGTNMVTLTVTDIAGLSSVCEAIVTVEDTISPVAMCRDITVYLDSSGKAKIAAGDIDNGSTDNCEVQGLELSRENFNCNHLGVNEVVLTVTDSSGNTSACSAQVSVKDTILPLIICPADITVFADDADCNPKVKWKKPVTEDNCKDLTITSTHSPGDCFPAGTTVVTYTITDGAGNITSCSFKVTVTREPLLASITGTNVSCHGGSDGSATVKVKGGCKSYTYKWGTLPVQTGPTAEGLIAGEYTVTVTDGNNTSLSETIVIGESDELIANAGNNKIVYIGYQDSACVSLAVNISGGHSGYHYLWSSGETTSMIGVCPEEEKTYTVTVTDRAGCSSQSSVKVCAVDVLCGRGPGRFADDLEYNRVYVCYSRLIESKWFKREITRTFCLPVKSARSVIDQPGWRLGSCNADLACETDEAVLRKGDNEDLISESITDEGIQLEAFPNPFTHKATIQFSVPESDWVVIKVYNLSGEEVAEIYDGWAEGNVTYEVSLSGDHLPGGIYFYQLATKMGRIGVQKITLSK